ncbi:MAG TPA: glycosyltransferase family 10 [Chryseolinea sp.]|nr:glycosyltransferase family 10 [Chryseolinea sp.]
MLIRIVKDWEYPETFFLQTPNGNSRWGDIEYTQDKVADCDYLIVLQRPPYDIKVKCPAGNAWLIMQEPPVDYFRFYNKSIKYFDKVFTYYKDISHSNFKSLQPVLPWHVLRSYDELTGISRNDLHQKKDEVVWITSKRNSFPGQKARMLLKDHLVRKGFSFHLFGNGFQRIDDKFLGLFPNKYSIAVENYSTENYWTEKLADSFLSWCLPFYWGAPNAEDYFPEKSFIRIDVNKPSQALKIMSDAIKNKEWERRLDAIEEARNLILNKYQFFPYISAMIKEDTQKGQQKEVKDYFIPRNRYPYRYTLINKVKYYLRRLVNLLKK